MKKLSLPIIFAVYFALSGCATQNVLEPTPEEAPKFAQHKLAEVPSSQEALIYAINWTSNDKQRIRPLHVKVGDQEKIVEPERYSIFRVNPETHNITVTGLCRFVTAEQLKLIMATTSHASPVPGVEPSYYGGQGGKTYSQKKDAKLFVAEAGKSYFLWLNAGCFFNRYDGAYNMYSHINTVTEDQGRYLTFKTRLAP